MRVSASEAAMSRLKYVYSFSPPRLKSINGFPAVCVVVAARNPPLRSTLNPTTLAFVLPVVVCSSSRLLSFRLVPSPFLSFKIRVAYNPFFRPHLDEMNGDWLGCLVCSSSSVHKQRQYDSTVDSVLCCYVFVFSLLYSHLFPLLPTLTLTIIIPHSPFFLPPFSSLRNDAIILVCESILVFSPSSLFSKLCSAWHIKKFSRPSTAERRLDECELVCVSLFIYSVCLVFALSLSLFVQILFSLCVCLAYKKLSGCGAKAGETERLVSASSAFVWMVQVGEVDSVCVRVYAGKMCGVGWSWQSEVDVTEAIAKCVAERNWVLERSEWEGVDRPHYYRT